LQLGAISCLIAVREYIDRINKSNAYKDPLVTEVAKLGEFYKAEDYHQDYFKNNPAQSYCSFVVAPKVKKIEKEFKTILK